MIFEIKLKHVFNTSSVVVYSLNDGDIKHIATDIKSKDMDEVLNIVEFSINRLISMKNKEITDAMPNCNSTPLN